MEKSPISAGVVIGFVLGVIVGIIIMSLLPDGERAEPAPLEGTDQAALLSQGLGLDLATTEIETEADGNRGEPVITRVSHVAVADQPAGAVVMVTDIALNQVTWLAVKEELPGGAGNILGARRLEAGLHDRAVVTLLRPTVVGGQYIVLLYEDDGDRLFDHKLDRLVTEAGSPVAARFAALAQ